METVFWQLWWVWLAAALGLSILEILVPGFIFLGFAVGAALMALLVLLPLGLGLAALLAIFAILSLLAWVILRRVFRAPDDQSRIIREDINK
ncbi:NfeD family protein [Roseovarius sp.]|uniref:NfeD family protein n=1 Tax=Roseovarius sp. TaxID=1486281 RepID=UPI003A972D59